MKQFSTKAAALAALSAVAFATDARPADEPIPDPLTNTISTLDGAVFDAFNHCSASGQLQKHASYFADDVEFYHDTGGVTWTRDAMLANTEKHVCGKIRRELVPGTLKVFPIKDYGAIEQGVHRFCQVGATECEGMADFVIVWRRQDMQLEDMQLEGMQLEGMQSQGTQWQITRVLSYGHRPNAAPAR